MTRRLVTEGAVAVVLTGSHARSAAEPESDIDVTAMGERHDAPYMEVLGGELFSIAWRTVDGERAAMRDPARAGGAIPAWRTVRGLHDPQGIAAALRDEAMAWRWEDIGPACDAWVAEQVAGYAEEVHKLVGARRRNDRLALAVQRSILALRLGPIMAVAQRILYESENVLWHLLGQALGDPWRSAQHRALGLDAELLDDSADAALELYRLVANAAAPHLDERQRAVVDRALGRIEVIGPP